VEIKRERGLNEGREEIGEKGFMEREMEKDNLLFGILNPLCPFFFFHHHPHSYNG
jgi:hypothetical protein